MVVDNAMLLEVLSVRNSLTYTVLIVMERTVERFHSHTKTRIPTRTYYVVARYYSSSPITSIFDMLV